MIQRQSSGEDLGWQRPQKRKTNVCVDMGDRRFFFRCEQWGSLKNGSLQRGPEAELWWGLNLCGMKTVWAFNSTPILHLLFSMSCLSILWTLNKCYCVKCSRISPISFVYISQGSAATHLRYGGQYCMRFVANFSENTTVKKLRKSANICRSYEWMYSGTVFLIQCV